MVKQREKEVKMRYAKALKNIGKIIDKIEKKTGLSPEHIKNIQ